MKTVTVIIPTYNHGIYISEAIESILNQDYPKDKTEIIVVDDGSTDNTKEIVKKYKKVKYFYQKNNGQASALKLGIQKATGDYLFFLNADDVFEPAKVSKCVDIFSNNLSVSHICHPTKYLDKKYFIEKIPKKMKIGLEKGYKRIDFFLKNNLFFGGGSNFCGKSSILKKTRITDKIYMFPDEFLVYELLLEGFSYLIPTPLTQYRVHNSNYSKMSIAKKHKNIIATKEIYGILEKHLTNYQKKLYRLKAITSELRYKEALHSKTLCQIIRMWIYYLSNFLFNPSIIFSYKLIRLSIPQKIYDLFK